MAVRVNIIGELQVFRCPRCAMTKPRSAFNWCIRKDTGQMRRSSYCGECQSACSRESYERRKTVVRERAKVWAETHRDKMRQYYKTYYERNKAKVIAKNRRIDLANPERKRIHHQRWYAKHRDEYCAKRRDRWHSDAAASFLLNHRRRQLVLNAPGVATPSAIRARVEYYGGRCAYCGGAYEAIDHVIPLIRGGSNWPANLRPSCKSCNSKKNRSEPKKWFARLAKEARRVAA